MKHMRHVAVLLWLALAFAVGEQAALLHDLGHATQRLSQRQDSNPAPAKCDECRLYAPFSASLGSKAPVAPLVTAATPLPMAAAPAGASLARRIHFRAQAPPTFS
jgi:hypothetical protein